MLISRHIPPRLKLAGSRFYAWLVGVSYWGTDPAHSTSTNRRILMCNQYVLASFMLAVPFFLLKIDEPKPRLIFVLFWGLMISSLWLNKKGHHVAGRTVFGLTITNLFFWMGIAFDARWPEYKSGFLVLQMACYSVILLIFSLQTERKLTLAFLVMAAVQMVTFNYLDHQINVFYGIISRDQLIVQHGMLLVASLLIMVLSFSIYQGVNRKAEVQINLLLDQTRNQYNELESQNAEIIAQRDQLEALDRMKEDLTGMIVHDLKNPLNAVLGLASMPPEQQRLNTIRRAGQQMSQLVLNLLDIQKYETTSLVLQTEPLAATQLIGEALQQTEFLAEARGIGYQIDADAHLQVDADFELIVRVLVNLLTNAIKYAPTGDCLLLEARWDADRGAVFSLTDHGRGIPPEQLELIFDKFSQVSGGERSGKLRSTGLGLTFCRLTVESHGGTIAARSELGRFSTFEFNLPKARRTETAATTAPTRAVADFPNLPQDLRESQAELLERIARIPIYDVSALIDNLNQLPESPEIDRWKSAVEQAAFSGDNQRLQLLLQS